MRNLTEALDVLIQAKGDGLKRTAEAALIGRTSIWRWTRGHSFPRHAQALALASALGVSVERVLAAAKASQKKHRRAARRLAARELTSSQ